MKKRRARRKIQREESAIPDICYSGFGYQIPPDLEMVSIYFSQKRQSEIAFNFFHYYQKCGWKTSKGTPIRCWKVAATDWIFDHRQSVKLAQRKLENIM